MYEKYLINGKIGIKFDKIEVSNNMMSIYNKGIHIAMTLEECKLKHLRSDKLLDLTLVYFILE